MMQIEKHLESLEDIILDKAIDAATYTKASYYHSHEKLLAELGPKTLRSRILKS
jgi:hypothetical protein